MKAAIPRWTTTIKPACLPGGENPGIDTSCYISGFGKSRTIITWYLSILKHAFEISAANGGSAYSSTLMGAPIEILDHQTCVVGFRGERSLTFLPKASDRLICAGTLDGDVDTCTVSKLS